MPAEKKTEFIVGQRCYRHGEYKEHIFLASYGFYTCLRCYRQGYFHPDVAAAIKQALADNKYSAFEPFNRLDIDDG